MSNCPKCNNDELFIHTYGNYGGYCIFHCDKNDVSTIRWNKSTNEDVAKFWWALENSILIKSKNHTTYMTNIIFPTGEIVATMHAFSKSKSKKFYFSDCHFVYDLTISNTSDSSFIFLRSHFDNAFSLLRSSTIGVLSFKETTFNGTVTINEIDTKEVVMHMNIELSDCAFNESFFVKKSDIKTMSINNCSFNKIFKLELINTSSLSIKNSSFKDEFTINNEPHEFERNTSYLVGLLWLENIVFEKNFCILGIQELHSMLLLRDIIVSEKAIAIIGNSECQNLLIQNFQNLASNLKIVNVLVKNSLKTDNVTFGKCEFNNFNLLNATSLQIENTSFAESKFTNVRWGKINEDRFLHMDRQAARQLKAINNAQGETVIGNQFYALEMRLHSKELNWHEHFGEKLVQNIYGLISNHSNDWVLATIWFFAFGFLFAALAEPGSHAYALPLPLLFIIVGYWIYVADKPTADNPIHLSLAILGPVVFLFCLFSCNFEFLVALINPLNFKDSKDLLREANLVLVYICRLIEIFIGYQIIIAIRKNTKFT